MNSHKDDSQLAIKLVTLAFQEGLADLNTMGQALIDLHLSSDVRAHLCEKLKLSQQQLQSLESLIVKQNPSHTSHKALIALRSPEGELPEDIHINQARHVTRYIVGDEVGRGGAGRVRLVKDTLLKRSIAMKTPLGHKRTTNHLLRFINEAQATSGLEHPNIIPIYDLGVLTDGELFYTMKYVGKNNLRRVIHNLKYGHEETRGQFGLIRLLSIFNQVCMALDYAHSRGIVHRDIKPENILLGDYGEVILMDWGIACVAQDHKDNTSKGSTFDSSSDSVVGTPEYMAPEQALGGGRTPAVDIYSLGAVLYELLCFSPPFEEEHPVRTLFMVVKEKPVLPSIRAKTFDRHVPSELEAICMKAIAKTPEARYLTAKHLRDAVEAFIEGVRSLEWVLPLARERNKEADVSMARYYLLADDAREADTRVRQLEMIFEGWEPLNEKSEILEQKRRFNVKKNMSIQAFSDAEEGFLQALAYDRENHHARQSLAKLYWSRFLHAEQRDDEFDMLYFRERVQRYDTGEFEGMLNDLGHLSVMSDPPGATVALYRLNMEGFIFRTGTSLTAQKTPVKDLQLQTGNYIATVSYPDAQTVTHSFKLNRSQTLELKTQLFAQSLAASGFVFIPSGTAIIGGDSNALSSLPRQVVALPGFMLSERQVTLGEYLEFINDLELTNPAEAISYMPRTKGMGMLCQKINGVYVPASHLVTGPAQKRYLDHKNFSMALPVVGVSFYDISAYMSWRSGRDGRQYRLPTELEWERAARGGDGRFFPWGNHFDATFCKMARSRPEPAQLEPVATFENDTSPFGIRDMAGGVQEWTNDVFFRPGPTFEQRIKVDPELVTFERVCRGGAWSKTKPYCRCASRTPVLPSIRRDDIGFRLAFDPL